MSRALEFHSTQAAADLSHEYFLHSKTNNYHWRKGGWHFCPVCGDRIGGFTE